MFPFPFLVLNLHTIWIFSGIESLLRALKIVEELLFRDAVQALSLGFVLLELLELWSFFHILLIIADVGEHVLDRGLVVRLCIVVTLVEALQ